MREAIQNKLAVIRREALRPLVNIKSNAQRKASNLINQFKERKSLPEARDVIGKSQSLEELTSEESYYKVIKPQNSLTFKQYLSKINDELELNEVREQYASDGTRYSKEHLKEIAAQKEALASKGNTKYLTTIEIESKRGLNLQGGTATNENEAFVLSKLQGLDIPLSTLRSRLFKELRESQILKKGSSIQLVESETIDSGESRSINIYILEAKI
jgi:hypothetical protein